MTEAPTITIETAGRGRFRILATQDGRPVYCDEANVLRAEERAAQAERLRQTLGNGFADADSLEQLLLELALKAEHVAKSQADQAPPEEPRQ